MTAVHAGNEISALALCPWLYVRPTTTAFFDKSGTTRLCVVDYPERIAPLAAIGGAAFVAQPPQIAQCLGGRSAN